MILVIFGTSVFLDHRLWLASNINGNAKIVPIAVPTKAIAIVRIMSENTSSPLPSKKYDQSGFNNPLTVSITMEGEKLFSAE